MQFPRAVPVIASLVLLATGALGATSDWVAAPQPKFPSNSLQRGSEGVVRLRIRLAPDGSVAQTTIAKSSGDSNLDETARHAVLKWKLKPSAIKPLDLTKGRIEEVEFRQEAMMSASYPLGVRAGFSNEHTWKPWIFAPFPYYPIDSRRLRHTGKVVLHATVGREGQVVAVQVVQSSGYSDLDEQATKALRHWKAHRQYAGQTLEVPVTFTLGWH